MLDLKDSIGRNADGTYLFKCLGCHKTIKSKKYYLPKHSGLCRSCVMKKRPFEYLFTKLKNTAKNESHEITLTYEDFLEFTKTKLCHYCTVTIEWKPFCYENSKYIYGAYHLDRKDNRLGYTKDNCIVCCTKCNIAKGNRYTYEEWLGMNAYFRKN